MARVQAWIRDEQLEALREQSRQTGRPIAALVRDAIDASLDVAERRRVIERALTAVGGFHSGLGDVAENHDESFVQAIEERIGRR
jgi:hypothetical protein